MLKRCEDMNLVLNWEKIATYGREGNCVRHKNVKVGIEVDRAKVDVIAKLPHPTTVKGVRSFLGHADSKKKLNQSFDLSCPGLEPPFERHSGWQVDFAIDNDRSSNSLHYYEKEMLAVVYAFEKFPAISCLIINIMYTDHSALSTYEQTRR
ncbi:hypothetical protein Tco_0709985 [Tanacetum coccineum]